MMSHCVWVLDCSAMEVSTYNFGRLVPASTYDWFWSADLLQGMGANVELPTHLGALEEAPPSRRTRMPRL
jgi:hypothetical protein